MKTAKRRITQIILHDRPGTLVFKWDVGSEDGRVRGRGRLFGKKFPHTHIQTYRLTDRHTAS